MIPRIKQTRFHRHEKKHAFARGDEARPLRIFVDSATTQDSEALRALLDFAHHDQVEVVTTDGRSSTDLTIGTYDQQHNFTSIQMNFPDGRRMHGGVAGPDSSGSDESSFPLIPTKVSDWLCSQSRQTNTEATPSSPVRTCC